MTHSTLLDRIRSGRILVSDGAWGTQLQARGLPTGECPEQWCLDHPSIVREIARSYAEAGADLIKTNSFGGSRLKLAHYGLADRAVQINEAAARLSREGAGPDRRVLGSIGPSGILLMMGEVTEEEMIDAFAEQASALERGGADTLCIETMSATDEAVLAIRAARAHTSCEVACTFTFERNNRGEYRTMMGLSPEDAARAAVDAGAHLTGTNCGNGMARMIEIVRLMRSAIGPHVPLLVHANAGLPEIVNGAAVFPETPAEMASQVDALLEAGARIVGGCCGTGPAHISALRAAVDARCP